MRFTFLVLFLAIWQLSFAQQDTLVSKISQAKSKLELKADSIKRAKLDSLIKVNPIGKIENKGDSFLLAGEARLSAIDSKIDSLTQFNPLSKTKNKLDSISGLGNTAVNTVNAKIDGIENALQNKVDSIQQNVMDKLEPVTGKIESAIQTGENRLSEIQDNISQNAGGKLNELSTELGEKPIATTISGVDKNVLGDLPTKDGINVPKLSSEIPELNSPLSNVELGGKDLNLNQPDINTSGIIPDINTGTDGKLNLKNLSIPGTDGLSGVTEKLNKVTEIKSDAGKVLEGVKDVKENGLRSVETDDLEKKAFELSGAGEMTDKMKEFNRLKLEQDQMIQKYRDKKLVEAELKRKMTNVVNEELNAFSPAVKKAQTGIAHVKKVKPAIATLKEASRRHPNTMKGKSLSERLVPGLAIQIFRGNDFSLDLSPQVGYRISGKWSAGIGAQYRIVINKRFNYYVDVAGVYGGRVYSDLKVIKSFYVHAEFESLKLEAKAIPQQPENAKHVVYSSHFGIGKQFNMSKRVSAYILGFYRLEHSGHLPGVSKYNTRLVLNLRQAKKKRVSVAK